MTVYGAHPPGHPTAAAGYPPMAPPGRPRRPAILTVALVSALLAAVLDIVASIMVIVIGKSAVSDAANRILGDLINVLPPAEQQKLLDEAYSAMVTKAVVAMVPAGLVLVFALLSFGGALWARIVVAVVAIGSICGTVPTIIETEIVPTGIAGLEIVSWVLVLVTVVMLFLPPVNRYARARRTAPV